MKTRFTIDLKVFTLILKELRSMRRELKALGVANTAAAKPKPAPRDITDKMYSSDVMKKLRITPATLINYEKKGLIKYHKEGRDKVYSEAEILAFKKLKGRRKRLSKKFNAA